MSVTALVHRTVAVSFRRTGWRRNHVTRFVNMVLPCLLEFPGQPDAGRAAILLDGLLQVLLGHRVRVLRVEEVADAGGQLPGAPERLDEGDVRGGRGAHLPQVEAVARVGTRESR